VEIRRIHEPEGDAVASLWDRLCREIEDGGPLSETGYRNIARMLSMSAWHHAAYCLVAEDDGDLVGFVNGRVDVGDGLLPGAVGEIETCYVVPDARRKGVGRALVDAAIAHCRAAGAGLLRLQVCADDRAAHAFWRSLGFDADMTVFSRYDLGAA
jgi:GNAT superfamily N-acetyltransferase